MIHSVAGKTENHMPLMTRRPFRSPHHTSSDISLTGGGPVPQPGEISLAHNGILFLDELPDLREMSLKFSASRWKTGSSPLPGHG
jgi:magnesium chelatase family protein